MIIGSGAPALSCETNSNAMGNAVTRFKKGTADWCEAGGDESVAATDGGGLREVGNTARKGRKGHVVLVVAVGCKPADITDATQRVQPAHKSVAGIIDA